MQGKLVLRSIKSIAKTQKGLLSPITSKSFSLRDVNLVGVFMYCVFKKGNAGAINAWDAIGYEYGLSSSNGWTKRAYNSDFGGYVKGPVLWAEIGESSLIGLDLVQETTDKFEVGDQVLLRVSPWKDVMHFGNKGKLAPSEVHDTFHVSNLKKCLADVNLHVPLDDIKIEKTLHFVKEPVEIMDREVKTLKRSKIPIVKVRWNSKRGPEFTWSARNI
ncbi:hypothetical protein Tco_1094263 [Tanacetum coccineum]|uniref:Reverse transcriptase domain-containing protein n=1 Tax=Tanacetum coccineum TaxID=301880 RepID=A0ABQ5IGA2_9ASTR